MMHFEVSNIRGISHAQFDARRGDITFIGGPNASGKSSLVKTIGACAAAVPLPAGLAKKDAMMLVHEGATDGFIEISDGDIGTVRLDLPDAKISTKGVPPRANLISAGLMSIMDMKGAERILALTNSIGCQPGESDLVKALRDLKVEEEPMARQMRDEGKTEQVILKALHDAKLSRDLIGDLSAQLLIDGWDGTWKRQQEERLKLKVSWGKIADRSYGVLVAANWKPTAWTDDLEHATLFALEKAETDVVAAHRNGIGHAAVSDAERKAKQLVAATLEQSRADLLTAQSASTAASAHVSACRANLDQLPSADEPVTTPCPHCGAPVQVGTRPGGTFTLIAPGPPLATAELKKRRMDHAAVSGDLSNAISHEVEASRGLNTAQANVNAGEAAQRWIDEHPVTDGPVVDLVALNSAVIVAGGRIKNFKARLEARAVHKKIVQIEAIITMLSPDGLRRKALLEGIKLFNDGQLAELSTIAGWKPVTVVVGNDDIDLRYGGRPFVLQSASEQWRAKAVLQVAQAENEQADLLMLDGCDIMVAKEAKQGLLNLIIDRSFAAIATIAYDEASKLPDLAVAELGHSYWVEDGVLRDVAAQIEPKAAE